MKGLKTIFFGAAALLAAVAPVGAADLLSTKDGTPQSNLIGQAWNGAYVEVGAGPGFVQTKVAGVVTLSERGTEGTFRLGYDYRFPNSRFAVGVYGDVSNSFDVNGNIANFIKLGDTWQYGFGAKFSFDHGAGQVYGIVGPAWEGFNFSGALGSSTHTSTGLKYGGGVNVKVVGPWYVGLELTQTDWGSFTVNPVHLNVTNTDNAVRIFTGVTF